MSKLSSQKGIVVGTLGLTQTVAFGSTYYLPAMLADPISNSLNVSTEWFFGIFSGALLLTAFFGPTVGFAIDRYGGRKILVISNLLFSVGLLLLAMAFDLISLGIAWAVLGIGMAFGLYEAAFAALIGLYGNEAQKSITGITLIAGFASTVGWPVTIVLLNFFGWRGACITWALIHILIALPLNLLLIPSVLPSQSEKPSNTDLSIKTLLLLASIFAIATFISTALATHLPRLLSDLGIALQTAIVVSAFLGPAQVFSRLMTFGFFNRYSPINYTRFALILYPIGGLCLFIMGISTAAIFVILYGIGNGILTIARGTVPLALFGVADYGMRTGLLAIPIRLSQALAPFLFGLLLDHKGPNTALLFSIGLSVIAFIVMINLTPAQDNKKYI